MPRHTPAPSRNARHPQRRAATHAAPARALLLATGACAALTLAPWAASAQQAPPPAKAAPAAPAAAAKPKPAKTAVVKEPAKSADPAGKAASGSGQAIAVLVNDEPITAFEIAQRQRMMGLSANIQQQATDGFKRLLQNPATTERLKGILNEVIEANRGKSREQIIAIFEERKKQFAQSLQKQAVESARSSVLPGLRKQAIEELIDEKLKLQEAKRLNVVATDEDANRLVKGIAERNKMTEAQFAQHMKGMGVDISTMRSRFLATISWQQVVRRRFGHQIAITERDVDRMVASAQAGEDAVELQVRRITLPLPAKIEQKAMAARMQEAEALRGKFQSCSALPQLAAASAGAKYEDLGTRKPAAIPEPTRSLLLNARDGEMLPPTLAQGGVELWAVCGRNVVKAEDDKRSAAQEELRQRELEVLAKRHLKDLRQDAHIEYR